MSGMPLMGGAGSFWNWTCRSRSLGEPDREACRRGGWVRGWIGGAVFEIGGVGHGAMVEVTAGGGASAAAGDPSMVDIGAGR